MIYRLLLMICFSLLMGCGGKSKPKPQKVGKTEGKEAREVLVENKTPFIYRELLVKGDDTGMIKISSKPKINIEDIISQRWELIDVSNVRVFADQEGEDLTRDFDELCLFSDKRLLQDPWDNIHPGNWKAQVKGKALLLNLNFADRKPKQYVIRSVSATDLELMEKKESGYYIRLNLSSDGLRHENEVNDPFHPVNNSWRIKPQKQETEEQIKTRVRQCIKFFALYYRDNIKRNAEEISFRGLPKVFKWYSGGIGVYERIELDESWIDCFYNKQQAERGYEIIRKLITDKRYDWHTEAPNWVFQTHSVLEQMWEASL